MYYLGLFVEDDVGQVEVVIVNIVYLIVVVGIGLYKIVVKNLGLQVSLYCLVIIWVLMEVEVVVDEVVLKESIYQFVL